LIEKDALAAAASSNIFATRLQMLRSNQPPTVSGTPVYTNGVGRYSACMLPSNNRGTLHSKPTCTVQQDPKLEGEQRDVISSRKEVATAAEALAASIS
jgi:hypothetical protein